MKETLIILKKELLEIFRDKSTLLFLLIPLIIFPAFNFGLEYLNKNTATEIDVCVNYDSQSVYETVNQFILYNNEYDIELVNSIEPEVLLKNGDIDSYIKIEDNSIGFIYNSASYDSLSLTTKLSESFQQYYNSTLSETYNNILKLELRDENGNIGNASSSVANIFIPIIFVMLIFQSSSSFANDLFAGEKERKTLEMLLLSGAKKHSIYCGKTFALAILAIVNLFLSLLSYFFSFKLSENGLEQFKFMQNGNTTMNIIFMIIILIELSLISVFISSTVSMLAKSMKSSQLINEFVLVIPIGIIVILVLGVLKSNALILNYIPLVNLLANLIDVFSGNINIGYLILTILSNILLIIVMIFFSVRYMKTEKFLS